MRTSLNLSSRPFTNHRVFWIATGVVFFTGLWFFLWVAAEQTQVSAKADEVKLRIESQRERAEAAKTERENREREQHQVVITEQDKVELASARHLILQKSFSWNRLISDLEQLVPKQARIAAIKVEGISDAGQGLTAKVLVKAIGATSAQMTEMMTSVEGSGGIFVINQADQDAVVETGEVPFTLELIYRTARGEAQ